MYPYATGGIVSPPDPFATVAPGLRLTAREVSAIRQAQAILGAHNLELTVKRRAPIWKPGDVVTIRFNGPRSTPFTYVRGRRDWPGDGTRQSDAEVTRHWHEGRATLVMRDGEVVGS